METGINWLFMKISVSQIMGTFLGLSMIRTNVF